jgi:hypothetical protein
MQRRRWVWIAVLFAALLSAAAARAEELSIHYAEPLALRVDQLDPPKNNRSLRGAAPVTQRLSFVAYGRQFVLELESNARLLAALPATRRQALQARHQLYRGRLEGLPGSWVRLTRTGGKLSGVIWDGRDMYSIAPARDTARFVEGGLSVQGDAPVIYRLRDAHSGLSKGFCAVLTPGKDKQHDKQHSALDDYQAMVSELTHNQALASIASDNLRGQLEVALLADSQFVSDHSQDPQAAILARANIVDGIFFEQVRVVLVFPEIVVFNSNNNPFTTNKASDLLDQVANYRRENNSVRERGLAHLMTGRNLDGDTAGIAY